MSRPTQEESMLEAAWVSRSELRLIRALLARLVMAESDLSRDERAWLTKLADPETDP